MLFNEANSRVCLYRASKVAEAAIYVIIVSHMSQLTSKSISLRECNRKMIWENTHSWNYYQRKIEIRSSFIFCFIENYRFSCTRFLKQIKNYLCFSDYNISALLLAIGLWIATGKNTEQNRFANANNGW